MTITIELVRPIEEEPEFIVDRYVDISFGRSAEELIIDIMSSMGVDIIEVSDEPFEDNVAILEHSDHWDGTEKYVVKQLGSTEASDDQDEVVLCSSQLEDFMHGIPENIYVKNIL